MRQFSLNVVNSNDLSILSFICSNRISLKSNNVNPFARDKIIVMNKGMQMYLQQEIAHNNLICSGIDFSPLWAFIWDLHKTVSGADSYNRYDHEHICWSLFSMIDKWKKKDDPVFASMREYLLVDDGEDEGAKAYQLCGAIADCFDQYQMYRPGWIREWNKMTLSDFEDITQNNDGTLLLKEGKIKDFIKSLLGSASSKNDRSLEKTLYNNIWQIKLWVMLRENLNATVNEQSSYDRATVIYELVKALNDPKRADVLKKKLPRRLYIFGVTSMPSQVIDLFCAIGKHIEVLYMLLNPCQEYWGDLSSIKADWKEKKKIIVKYLRSDALEQRQSIGAKRKLVADVDATDSYFEEYQKLFDNNENLVDGNALLISLGKECKDTFNELLSRDTELAFTNVFCSNVDPDDKESDTVLNRIKDQLLTLNSKEKYKIRDDDSSIEFHSCHTPLREVEVLRDRMLDIFKKEKNNGCVSTKNFLVMVPDIETYSPLIESVFGSVSYDDPAYIPYAVCDRTAKSDNKIASAIIELLSIGSRRITASLVIDLLSIESIARKFGISKDEVSVIAEYLKKANIHWGLDEEDVKEELNAQIDLPWTLSNGIDRIVDGFFKGSDIVGGACSDVDTGDFELINKFCAFVNKLKQIRDEFSPNLDLTNDDWTRKLRNILLDGLFSDEQNEELLFINKILQQMNESISNLKAGIGSNEEDGHTSVLNIKLPVFRAKLEHAFGNDRDSSKYLRGKVNFCSFIPMRAVPFDYIFLLGMNDGEFPRKEVLPNFNLMGVKSLIRNNDRQKSVDDRFLFLESIMSAKKKLYISYIGQSPIDKSELNPSPVVIELIEHITENFYVNCDVLDEENNLKDIKSRLFRQETLNSYDIRNYSLDEQNNLLRTVSYNKAAFWFDKKTSDKDGNLPIGYLTDENIDSLKNQSCDLTSLSLDELTNFFRNPCKAFLKEKMNISNVGSVKSSVCEDNEPIMFGNFKSQFLVNDLFSEFMNYYFKDHSFNTDLILNEHPSGSFREINKAKILGIPPEDFVVTFLDLYKKQGAMPYSIFFEKEKKKIIEIFSNILRAFATEAIKDNFAGKSYSVPIIFETSMHEQSEITLEGTISEYSNYIIDPFHDDLTESSLYSNFLKALSRIAAYNHSISNVSEKILFISNKGDKYALQNIPSKDEIDSYLAKLVYYYDLMKKVPVPITKRFMDKVLVACCKKDPKTPEELFYEENLEIFKYEDEATYLFKDYQSLQNLCEKQKEIVFEFADSIVEMYKSMRIVKEEL